MLNAHNYYSTKTDKYSGLPFIQNYFKNNEKAIEIVKAFNNIKIAPHIFISVGCLGVVSDDVMGVSDYVIFRNHRLDKIEKYNSNSGY
eukprot:Pgem_evm1s11624